MATWEPVRRRWYVERRDMGREVWIVQTIEDAQGYYRFLVLTPQVTDWMLSAVGGDNPRGIHPLATIVGNEPADSRYTPDEAQELMDAMWAAGMRPTRR